MNVSSTSGSEAAASDDDAHPLARHEASSDRGTITRILTRQGRERDTALAEAVAVVYDDLRAIAGRHMAAERRRPTFDTESLIHEVYVRLVRQDRTVWRSRSHLFSIASRMMRRILVDRARRRGYAKRGGGQAHTTTLDGKELPAEERRIEVLALEDALADLERHDARLARIVEQRFYGGLTNREIATLEGVTPMTVIRDWRLARAFLQRHLTRRSTSA